MEFIEHIFQKIWKSPRIKSLNSKKACRFADIERYLDCFVSFGLPLDKRITIQASLATVGLSDLHIFLPDLIDLYESFEKNKKAYLYLCLKVLALETLEKKEWTVHRSKIANVLTTLSRMDGINRWLDSNYPFFSSFEEDFLKNLDSISTPSEGRIESFWRRRLIARRPMTSDDQAIFFQLLSKQKRNDTLPLYLLTTVPSFLGSADYVLDTDQSNLPLKIKSKMNEKENSSANLVQRQSLEKEKNNPVIHSFEKLETVDEYEGGRRFDSGSDELDKHQNALNEIEMRNVTVDGETTQSLYSTESLMAGHAKSITKINPEHNRVYYDEWDEKTTSYLVDYCALHVHYPLSETSENVRAEILEKHRGIIEFWRKKILQVFNQPLWKNRQWEGEEVDVDHWGRAMADMKSLQTPDFRIFSTKSFKDRDLAIGILFDESLSTDSWIDDFRVIDMIKESVGISGLLMENIISQTVVAGTSSATRKNCQLTVYKSLNDSWDDFLSKVKKIEPRGYTRLGPAVRHMNTIFQSIISRKKILIILTDGKPTDLDHYEGAHGISDVRKAVDECENRGLQVITLVLDKKMRIHFKKMFPRYKLVSSIQNFSRSLFELLYEILNE